VRLPREQTDVTSPGTDLAGEKAARRLVQGPAVAVRLLFGRTGRTHRPVRLPLQRVVSRWMGAALALPKTVAMRFGRCNALAFYPLGRHR
jgi:hypothetical protein